MQVGQTKELIDEATFSSFSGRVVLKTGEGGNRHRVLRGPFRASTVYWPTLVNEEGELKPRMKTVTVPPTGSEFVKKLASVEEEVRRTMGENEPKSQFKTSHTFLYLIFDREDETDPPEVKVASYKYSVYKRLEEIQRELSTKDKSFLKYGLIFMYDVIVKKIVEDPNRPIYTTKYKVEVDIENNPMQGRVPADVLNLNTKDLNDLLAENDVFSEVFTPEEIEIIDACKIKLDEETKPNTEAEIIAKFHEFPINLQAKNPQTGMFHFPQNDRFISYLKNMELPLLGEGNGKALKEPEKEQPQKETEKEPIEDAEVVEEKVKEEVEEKPKKETEKEPKTKTKRW